MSEKEFKSLSAKVDTIGTQMKAVQEEVGKMSSALLGGYEKKGIISEHHENSKWIKEQKENKKKYLMQAVFIGMAVFIGWILTGLG